jgi:hypothetical protein
MDKKFAVLIDVDNISYTYAKAIIDEVKRYGDIVICRAYGDWSNDRLQTWKYECSNYAIRPMMQIQAGKNSSDGLIFLDAMEIKAMNPIPVDSFCLVSSDSDFSSLSIRLRESGYYVIGIGNENAKTSYINTFQKYIFLSNINVLDNPSNTVIKNDTGPINEDPANILVEAYSSITDEKNWVFLSTVGSKIYQKYPSFDYRTYGFPKMLDFVKACSDQFEIKTDSSTPPGYLIKLKESYIPINTNVHKDDKKCIGVIEKIVGNFGFIRYENHTYYFHELNLLGILIKDISKGDNIKFSISKEPNDEGMTNQEKNGIASEIEKI